MIVGNLLDVVVLAKKKAKVIMFMKQGQLKLTLVYRFSSSFHKEVVTVCVYCALIMLPGIYICYHGEELMPKSLLGQCRNYFLTMGT